MNSKQPDTAPSTPETGEARTQLDEMAPYLLAIATKRLRRELWHKIAPSDIVQEALFDASQRPNRQDDMDEGHLKAWLRRIVVNKVIDTHRRFLGTEKRGIAKERSLDAAPPENLAAADSTPSSLASKIERVDSLLGALNRLPEDRRVIMQLRYHEGLAFDEIAERTGRTTSSVRNLWWRTIEALRAELV